MATPKEQHDARELARKGSAQPRAARDVASAAPAGAEDQADGQPENELELHDHSPGERDAGGVGDSRRSRRRAR